MSDTLPEELIEQTARLVESRLGLLFPPNRWDDLERGLRQAAEVFGKRDAQDLARWLTTVPLTEHQVASLAGCLTIGETYFMRGRPTMNALRDSVLRPLVARRAATDRRLKVWCAACATGEEPYSVAILLNQLLPETMGWQVIILATDINPHFLAKARAGVYGDWSFRDAPRGFRETYFHPVGEGSYEILPHLRRMVTFSQLNLAQDVFPALLNNTTAVDVILCRNVLMYFSAPQQRRVIHGLYRCLTDEGWLVVAPTEVSSEMFPEFVAVDLPDVVFFHKGDAPSVMPGLSVAPWLDEASHFCAYPQVSDVLPTGDGCRPPVSSPPLVPSDGRAPATPSPEDSRAVPAPDSEPANDGPLKRARRLFEAGRYQQAVDIFSSMDSQNLDSENCCLAAQACANRGQLEEALGWCQRAVGADPLYPFGHFLRASVHMEMGNAAEASADLRRALFLDPDFVLAHYLLGNLCLMAGRRLQAAKSFENARQLAVSSPPDEPLPYSGGLAPQRLVEIVDFVTDKEQIRG